VTDRPRVGVGVLGIRGDHVLLIRRAGGHGADTWAAPGGHLDPGEALDVGARRELAEELGLEVDHVDLLGITSDVHPDGRHYVTVTFVAAVADDVELRPDAREVAEARWFDLRDLPSPLFLPLQHLVAGRGHPTEAWARLLARSPAPRPTVGDGPRLARAVLPVGGTGSRLHPLTHAVPKALLPLGGRPVLHHALEEVADAGVREAVVVVASPTSHLVAEHLRSVDGWPGLAIEVVEGTWPSGLAATLASLDPGTWPAAVVLPDEVLADGGLLIRLARAHARHDEPIGAVVPGANPLGGMARLMNLARRRTAEPASPGGGPRLLGRYVVTPELAERFGAVDADAEDGTAGFVEALGDHARDQGLLVVRHDGPVWDVGTAAGYERAVHEIGPTLRR
jgi:8-oxo-dGTP diphosphatase